MESLQLIMHIDLSQLPHILIQHISSRLSENLNLSNNRLHVENRGLNLKVLSLVRYYTWGLTAVIDTVGGWALLCNTWLSHYIVMGEKIEL